MWDRAVSTIWVMIFEGRAV